MRNTELTVKINERAAKDCISAERIHRGEGFMIATPDRAGGYCIAANYIAKAIATGKAAGRIDKAFLKPVSEPKNIDFSFNVSVPDTTRFMLVALLLANGWSLAGKVNGTTIKVVPATTIKTLRGLQQRLTTFDNIVAQAGADIKKAQIYIDGVTMKTYKNSFDCYAKYDSLTVERRTTSRENWRMEKKK